MKTKKEILQKLEALQKEVREWREDKKEFPKHGDEYWYVTMAGHAASSPWVGVDWNTGSKEFGNCFRTEEDAKLMAEWLKAQRLTWMPEGGETWYWVEDSGTLNQADWGVLKEDYGLIATGNVHRTKEEAEAYGRLMKAVAKLKTDYLV